MKEKYLANAVSIVLCLVCVAPLITSPSTVFPHIVAKAVYSRVLIEIAFALWLILIAVAPEYRPRRSWCLAGLCAWLLACIVAALLGENILRSIWSTYNRMDGVVDLAHWSIFAVMIASMFRTIDQWRRFFVVNICIAALVASLGALTFLVPALNVTPDAAGSGTRVDLVVGSPFHLGIYLCLATGFVVIAASMYHNLKALWLIIPLIPCVVTLWLTASRAGILALAIIAALFLIGCLVLDRRRSVRILALTGLGAGLFAVVVITVLVVTNRGQSSYDNYTAIVRLGTLINQNDYTIKSRTYAASSAIRAYLDNPVAGVGPENFMAVWGRYHEKGWYAHEVFDHAHNAFFEVLATTGTVGIMAYLFLWGTMGYVAVRSIWVTRGNERIIAIALFSVMVGYLAISMISVDFLAFALYFALMLGYLINVEYQQALPAAPRRVSRRRMRNMRNSRGTPLFALRSKTAIVAGLVAVPLLAVCIVQYNYHLYSSAKLAQPARSVQEYINNEHRKWSRFSPMYNERRFVFLNSVLKGMVDPSADESYVKPRLSLIAREISEGMATDQNNWIWPFMAVMLYQKAAEFDDSYLGESRRYLARLHQLSPISGYTIDAQTKQDALENQRLSIDR